MANKKRKGERPDGLIQVSLDIGHKPDGTRIRKYFYGHSRAEANAKREAFRQHMQGGSRHSVDLSVAEWVEEFKATYRQNINPAYLSIDDVPYNRLIADIGYMRMIDVTEADLQKALNRLSGMSFSTCEKYRQAMRRVFERARKNKIVQDNPAEGLTLPAFTRGTHRALDAWEVELILANWNAPGLTAGVWVMLMLLCGLRRGEMAALDWSRVDLKNRLLTIQQVAVLHGNTTIIEQRAKTEAGVRTIPICQALYDALIITPPERREGPVCRSARGMQLTESAIDRGLETFCKGLERIANNEPPIQRGRRTDRLSAPDDAQRIRFHFRAHDLRHTYATFLYDAGVNVKAAQYFLGHADIRMTLNLYTHLSKERETESRTQAVGFLDRLLDTRTKNTLAFEPTALDEGNNSGHGGKMVVVPDDLH